MYQLTVYSQNQEILAIIMLIVWQLTNYTNYNNKYTEINETNARTSVAYCHNLVSCTLTDHTSAVW